MDFNRKLNSKPDLFSSIFWFESSFCCKKAIFLHFLPFGLKDGHFWQKWLLLDHKKWHFWWQNQNSKTTFIVQTIPKYCSKGIYFMNLSLLSQILVKFQFCWFSGLFWAFFPCKKYKKWNRRRTADGVLKSKNWKNKSGLEFNFLLKSKWASLNFDFWFLTEP